MHKYLEHLETLLLAYALWGTKPVATPHTVAGVLVAETMHIPSTKYVSCPLDVVMAYLYRAKERVSRIQPQSAALAWLITKDEGDRVMWLEKHRGTSATLGEIIVDTMSLRESMWEVADGVGGNASTSNTLAVWDAGHQGGGNPGGRVREPKKVKLTIQKPKGKGKGKGKAAMGQPVAISAAMKDGTKLCPKYQRGQCSSKEDCGQGRHMCGASMKNNRVCGGRHPATRCDNRAVPRK